MCAYYVKVCLDIIRLSLFGAEKQPAEVLTPGILEAQSKWI